MSNPLLNSFNTPFGVPPFDEIKVEHFIPAYAEALRTTLGDGALSTMKSDTDANMSQCLSCARQIYQNFMQNLS